LPDRLSHASQPNGERFQADSRGEIPLEEKGFEMLGRGRIKSIAVIAMGLVFAVMFTACQGSSASPAVEATRQAAEEHADADESMGADEHGDEGEHMEADEDMEAEESMDTDEHMDEGEHMDSDESTGSEGMMGMEHEHVETPAEYEGLTNPFAGDQEAIAEGAALFAATCATCHGETGMGDGPASVGLDPKPAALADQEMMQTMSDSYLFWRVNEGGAMEPFNSAMPSWKAVYGEDQIWKILAFVRTLGE
jgi:mono/diheme cytochrome c family protein